MLYDDRARRLGGVVAADVAVTGRFGLLLRLQLSASEFGLLRSAVRHYISACLDANHLAVLDDSPDPLLDARERILSLPNLTPNGLLLPKRDVALEFNVVQATVARIVRSRVVETELESIQLPLNIRLADGRPDTDRDLRAHASSKLHSDIWAGEPTHALMAMIPVLGDTSTNVEFFHPDDRLLAYVRTLPDFTEAAHLGGGARYPCELVPGSCYLMDPFVLHRTVRRGGGLRASIDFRMLARRRVPSDVEREADKAPNYRTLGEWNAVGVDRMVTPTESMAECRKRIETGSRSTAELTISTLA